MTRQADSHAIGKDDFADGMSHFHRAHPLSAGEDDLPRVVVDAHGKELTIPVRRFLADLGLPVIEGKPPVRQIILTIFISSNMRMATTSRRIPMTR